ncbi:MAG TPA: hypothetical protein VED22_04840 [Nitrososphaerales archaeon]|nr:hypothetical protein [Nitrososphaerales archaeon]
MQAAPKPPMTRAQKLRWYANQLMADAAADEKAGNSETAVSGYLQAADILLLLSKVEENYAAWKYYTDNAALCQQKARRLIALAPKGEAVQSPRPLTGSTPRS